MDRDRLPALDEAIQRFSEAWAAGDAAILDKPSIADLHPHRHLR
jgi:hypothetical protein